jgi:hypothetical protein
LTNAAFPLEEHILVSASKYFHYNHKKCHVSPYHQECHAALIAVEKNKYQSRPGSKTQEAFN